MSDFFEHIKQNIVSFIKNKRLFLKYYVYLKNRLNRQLRYDVNINDIETVFNKKIIIPIIETSHYQHLQILGLAKALELRGAKIKILICGGFLNACEIKSFKNRFEKNPCSDCLHHIEKILPLFSFDTLKLSDLITEHDLKRIKIDAKKLFNNKTYEYLGYDFKNSLDDSIERYYYGKVPDDKHLIDKLRLDNIETAIIGIISANKILNDFKPDIFLNNMNSYTTWSPLIDVFLKNNVQKVLISMASFNFKSIRFNIEDIFKDTLIYKNFKSKRNTIKLSKDEDYELMKFMNDRVTGDADSFKKYKYFSKNSKNIFEEIKTNNKKRNIFMFPNLLWDTGITENNTGLFENVLSWVFKTIDIAIDNKDVNLFIKTHPAEEFSSVRSAKTVYDHVMGKYSTLPSNISFILPKMKINSYQLFKYIDLGLIYNGTIGLEMLLSGIPVVSVGRTVYNDLGFSCEPKNIFDYKSALLNNIQFNYEKMDEIKLFAYFYFIKTQIPWTLTSKVWGENFNGFKFNKLHEILPGNDKQLDHLCLSILNPESHSVYDDIAHHDYL